MIERALGSHGMFKKILTLSGSFFLFAQAYEVYGTRVGGIRPPKLPLTNVENGFAYGIYGAYGTEV